MKKTIILFLSVLLLGSLSLVNAELIQMDKTQMLENSAKYEEMKNRKIYHRYNGTYSAKDADNKLLMRLDTALEKIQKSNPKKLRKLYAVVEKKLEALGKRTRTTDGGITDKKGTRIYFLLEKINNKISDFEGNQDLGCEKGIGHMEGSLCVNNKRTISNDSGTGYQSYDFINGKWLPVMMMRCNDGYTKETKKIGDNNQVLCVESSDDESIIEDIINDSSIDPVPVSGANSSTQNIALLNDCGISGGYLQSLINPNQVQVTSENFEFEFAKWHFNSHTDCEQVEDVVIDMSGIEDLGHMNGVEDVSCELEIKTGDVNSSNLLVERVDVDMNGGVQEFDIDNLHLPAGPNYMYFGLDCRIDRDTNYSGAITDVFDFDMEFESLDMESSLTGDGYYIDLNNYDLDFDIDVNVNIQ